jgi:hypothetical protein
MRQFAAALAALLLAATPARADGLDRLADGAPFYLLARPMAVATALRRLGVGELDDFRQLKRQLGGVDPLDPALLAPTGLDVSAPVAALGELVDASTFRLRVVAQLRDPSLFTTFLAAIAASGQAPMLRPVAPGSPAARQNVIASADFAGGRALARVQGGELTVDVVGRTDGAGRKPLDLVTLARRFPLGAKAPFHADGGGRRLLSPDAALTLYVDARRLGAVLEAIARNDAERAPSAERPRKLKQLARCRAEWEAAPTTFDDLALSLAADPAELRLTVAEGTRGGAPLALRLSPVDDGALDAAALARQAPAVVALYLGSLAPFRALRRGPPLRSVDELDAFSRRCGEGFMAGAALRAWPQLVGAALDAGGQAQAGPLSSLLAAGGGLRNLVFALRKLGPPSSAFTVAATFDAAVRPMIDTALMLFGGGAGRPTTLGRCAPTLYEVGFEDTGTLVAGLEALKAGPVMLSLADSEDSLGWACKPASAPASASVPLALLHVDGAVISRMLEGGSRGLRPLGELLGRLRRLDAELVVDGAGDLFRLTFHSPLKD